MGLLGNRKKQKKKKRDITIERKLSSGTIDKPIDKSLDTNLKSIEDLFENADDLIIRRFQLGADQSIEAALLFLEGMVDKEVIYEQVLSKSIFRSKKVSQERGLLTDPIDIVKKLIPMADMEELTTRDDVLFRILGGSSILLIDSSKKALAIDAAGWQHRGVEQPVAEAVIRGPREGFTESVKINITLIRRRLKDPNLKIETMDIGRRSRTKVALLYIQDIINPDLLEEARRRLKAIDIDSVTDSGYIEQMITDSWWSPFSTTQETERPDEVVGGLLEGRFAIISDNSPFAILAPSTINSLMQSPEDYYQGWIVSSVIRSIRFIGSFLALVLPAFYISLVAFHPEMIPSELALSVAATRDGIPFISAVEALIMEVSLELLREAGVRLPGPIGQTIGIVGGLIIGDAAVSAGLVSPLIVIVVALTAIASFMVPTYSLTTSLRNLRFLLMVFAAFLGLFGLTMGMLLILVHLATLKSFGVSMLSPWSPIMLRDFQDTIIRQPFVAQKRRPGFLQTQNPERMKDTRDEANKRGANREK